MRGSGAALELAEDPIRVGTLAPLAYSYLPGRPSAPNVWFGSRLALLGNALGESHVRIAAGTPRLDDYGGHLAVLRPPCARFDDDTFSRSADVVGTSRSLELDFGPRYAGRRFYLLASSAGASPGQQAQGFTVPLNDDGPGGLWERTTSLQADGTPLRFSRLTGRLDAAGRATIVIEVTASAVGHPWFLNARQYYLPVLTARGNPSQLALVGAPTPLFVTD